MTLFAHGPRGNGIGVGIKTHGQSRSVPWQGAVVAAIGKHVGQSTQGLGLEPLDGRFCGGGVDPFVGHMIAPVIGLILKLGQVRK